MKNKKFISGIGIRKALIISRFMNLLLCLTVCSVFAQAQTNIRITGVVTDPTGESLPGVTISVNGTTIGTATDADGKYAITVPSANSVLKFSYIGYAVQEQAVGSRTVINITMNEDALTLEEVVVVGYGTQKKASLTSAISQISGAEAFKDRGINNVSVAL
ncbi:MAG: carboxypeptidase-like regulatory domain-containing protein, partial [Tannerella sp.]|nr:carboxypeptidase-like regulatory domain-containing protein [Tannerella sp.]